MKLELNVCGEVLSVSELLLLLPLVYILVSSLFVSVMVFVL